jgi:hypothetical protein
MKIIENPVKAKILDIPEKSIQVIDDSFNIPPK